MATLYDEPDRAAVDKIKAAMRAAIAASEFLPPAQAAENELKHSLKTDLRANREAVWKSARLVAAYELAAEFAALETFNRLWAECERRGGFKAARLSPPPMNVTTRE